MWSPCRLLPGVRDDSQSIGGAHPGVWEKLLLLVAFPRKVWQQSPRAWEKLLPLVAFLRQGWPQNPGALEKMLLLVAFLQQVCQQRGERWTTWSMTLWILSITTPWFVVSSPLTSNQFIDGIIAIDFFCCCYKSGTTLHEIEKHNTTLEKMNCNITIEPSACPIRYGVLLIAQVKCKSLDSENLILLIFGILMVHTSYWSLHWSFHQSANDL